MTDKELDELETRVSSALDVPDPSPLFWEHFPGRVRAAVAASPVEAPAPWWRRRTLALALSAAIAVGLSAFAYWDALRGAAETVQTPPSVADGTPAPDARDDVGDADVNGEDAGWQIVSSVAESAGVETLREAGFGIAPGGAEAAIDGMSEAERAELVALLRAEMTGDDGGL